MPFSGGTFSIINTFVGGTTILSAQVNQNYSDIATGLSTCILKDGTQAITATIPFSLAATAAVPVQIVSTNADANAGPILEMYRNSGSPVDGDEGPAIYFYGKDSGGTKTIFGSIVVVFDDITDTTEDGSIRVNITKAGSSLQYVFGQAEFRTNGNDLAALGAPSDAWSDLYLAAGGTINVGGSSIGALSSLARINTGSYTGDGATSKAITGVGFTPKYVKIWQRSTVANTPIQVFETTAEILDDNASGGTIIDFGSLTATPWFAINQIIALGADGFTVDDAGTDSAPNTNGAVYNYMCIG